MRLLVKQAISPLNGAADTEDPGAERPEVRRWSHPWVEIARQSHISR